MIENMKVRRFKEEDAQEVRNLIVRNFLEVNSKDCKRICQTYEWRDWCKDRGK